MVGRTCSPARVVKVPKRSPDATQQHPEPPSVAVLRVDPPTALEAQVTPIRRGIRRKRPVVAVRALEVDRGAKRAAAVDQAAIE